MSAPSALEEHMESVAIISDIHGNITALNEVFNYLNSIKVSRVICLGDLVGKGPQPSKAIDLCREKCDIVIKGNWDEMVLKIKDDEEFIWHYNQLREDQIEYLQKLPTSYDFRFGNKNIRLFHSSEKGIYERVHMHDNLENHNNMFNNTTFTGDKVAPDIVGYGDIHGAYIKYFRNKVLFNVGSVGNPLDINQASFVIIQENEMIGQRVLDFVFKRVIYNIEEELAIAKAINMPKYTEYEKELRTAVYRNRKD